MIALRDCITTVTACQHQPQVAHVGFCRAGHERILQRVEETVSIVRDEKAQGIELQRTRSG